MLRTVLMLVLLSSCASQPSGIATGAPVAAPQGFEDFCLREPWQRACGGDGVKQ